VTVDVPADWQDVQGFAGTQLMLLGPAENGAGRPVVVITNSGIRAPSLDEADAHASQDEYRAGRESWLGTHGGTSVRYFPHEVQQWDGLGRVQAIGFEYLLGSRRLVERTYYAACGELFFNFKTLIESASLPRFEKAVERILRGARCR
jgi:hypothetical protein